MAPQPPVKFTQLGAGLAVLRVARRFLDLHEIQPNAAWSRATESAELLALLKATGWQVGWPYCMAFVEACYATACERALLPELAQKVRQRFTPSVMRTYHNVRTLTHQELPQPGAVFFMQKGTTDLGHAGLVLMSGVRVMATIEGNTSPGIATTEHDREGDGIYLKLRPISFDFSPGLHLLGFLDPLDSVAATALLQEDSQ